MDYEQVAGDSAAPNIPFLEDAEGLGGQAVDLVWGCWPQKIALQVAKISIGHVNDVFCYSSEVVQYSVWSFVVHCSQFRKLGGAKINGFANAAGGLGHNGPMQRRDFLGAAAIAPAIGLGRVVADRLILISLRGGMAQTDTFDPKHYTPFEPGMLAENLLGTCRSIRTSAYGVRFGEGLRGIAGVMDRGCVIRSVAGSGVEHVRVQGDLLRGMRLKKAAGASFADQLRDVRARVEEGPGMVEAALPYVPFGGFDTHDRGGERIAAMKRAIDAPIAGLVRDLDERGLLARTLVVVASEFGRTVRRGSRIVSMEDYGFHEHFCGGYPVLLFGAGVRHGIAYGRTRDEHPMVAVENPVTVAEVDATIRAAMGLGGGSGEPIRGVLAL